MGVRLDRRRARRQSAVEVCSQQRYLAPLMKRVGDGEIDLSQIITHRLPLADAAKGYELFQTSKDGCIKVVMTP